MYCGQWAEGLQHGEGVAFARGGTEAFRGSYHQGARHGRGELWRVPPPTQPQCTSPMPGPGSPLRGVGGGGSPLRGAVSPLRGVGGAGSPLRGAGSPLKAAGKLLTASTPGPNGSATTATGGGGAQEEAGEGTAEGGRGGGARGEATDPAKWAVDYEHGRLKRRRPRPYDPPPEPMQQPLKTWRSRKDLVIDTSPTVVANQGGLAEQLAGTSATPLSIMSSASRSILTTNGGFDRQWFFDHRCAHSRARPRSLFPPVFCCWSIRSTLSMLFETGPSLVNPGHTVVLHWSPPP